MPAKVDAELDLHGYTGAAARDQLEVAWSRRSWLGLRRVRIIHGTGQVLFRIVRQWADEKSIPWTVEPHNPGVTILQPALRREQAHLPHRPFAQHHEKLRSVLNRQAQAPGAPAGTPEPASSNARPGSRDLFAEEMERLEGQDVRAMHRRKQGL